MYGKFITYVEPPWPYAVIYRARGVADLLGPTSAIRAPGALDRLVGGTRAEVLRAPAVPATTNQLVAVLGRGPGSVGGHLAVLREAGLVERARVGHAVWYARTPLGDVLAGP